MGLAELPKAFWSFSCLFFFFGLSFWFLLIFALFALLSWLLYSSLLALASLATSALSSGCLLLYCSLLAFAVVLSLCCLDFCFTILYLHLAVSALFLFPFVFCSFCWRPLYFLFSLLLSLFSSFTLLWISLFCFLLSPCVGSPPLETSVFPAGGIFCCLNFCSACLFCL